MSSDLPERLLNLGRFSYLQRIPIEGKFGQGKNGYRLNYIRAKQSDTSRSWINSIFLVMNLLILLKIFCALSSRANTIAYDSLGSVEIMATTVRARVIAWWAITPIVTVAI